MKLQKIAVNRSAERPEGVEIEIVQPESPLESRVLSFLLPGLVRDADRNGRMAFKVPDQFTIEHRGEGTFVLRRVGGEGGFYELPRPMAVLGIRAVGHRFDLVHAELKPRPDAAPLAEGAAARAGEPGEQPAAEGDEEEKAALDADVELGPDEPVEALAQDQEPDEGGDAETRDG